MSLFSRFVMLFFIACMLLPVAYGGGKTGKPLQHKISLKFITVNEDTDIHAYILSPSEIGRQGISLSAPFDPSRVLKVLIPGNYAAIPRWHETTSADSIYFVAWQCAGYPKKTLQDWEGAITFPFKENITELRDTLQYTDDKGVRHVLLSFATHEGGNALCMFCGRFCGVVMSLALLTEQKGKWVLSNFELAAGCYGAFQTLPTIKLIKLGNNNYGCYLRNGNGGAGAVYYSDMYVFAPIGKGFRKVLEEGAVSRENTLSSNWDMILQPHKEKMKTTFEPIEIRLAGTFRRYTPDPQYDTTDSPIELAKSIKGYDSFDFQVAREFRFVNGKYKKTASRAAVQH